MENPVRPLKIVKPEVRGATAELVRSLESEIENLVSLYFLLDISGSANLDWEEGKFLSESPMDRFDFGIQQRP
jgi:hypothetical protein